MGGEPLLDGLDGRSAAVALALAVEMPGAELLGMLVAGFYHGGGIRIVGAKLGIGKLECFFLGDAVSYAALCPVEHILVVAARLKVVAPLAEEFAELGIHFFDGDGGKLGALLLRLLALGTRALAVFGLGSLFDVDLLHVAMVEGEGR